MFKRWRNRNRRLHHRRRMDRFLGVYDEDKTIFLGRVEDLSINGMCVHGEVTVPVGRIVKLMLEIIHDDGGVETLYLRSRSLWVREDAAGATYRIGFQFAGISPSVAERVQRIIDGQRSALSA